MATPQAPLQGRLERMAPARGRKTRSGTRACAQPVIAADAVARAAQARRWTTRRPKEGDGKILRGMKSTIMEYHTEGKTDNQWLVQEEQRVYECRIDGKIARKRKQFQLSDAFAGAGGMTLGFSKKFGHAFDPVWANDFNDDCIETYNANFGEHCLPDDIIDILNDPSVKIPEADVVIGGPPCQGFSLLNKDREGDPRKQLWRPYFMIVERSGAKVFVMENVPQLLGSFEHGEIMGTAEAMGFKVWGDVLCAADYGVPQTRRRAFIIGCKDFDPARVFPPRRTHFDPSKGGAQISFLETDGNGYLPGAAR